MFAIEISEVSISEDKTLRRFEPLILNAVLCADDECYRAEIQGVEIPSRRTTGKSCLTHFPTSLLFCGKNTRWKMMLI